MTYERQTWANGAEGETPITAEALNHMEEGIEGAAAGEWRGPWDSETEYVVGDRVQYNGRSFIAIADHQGHTPGGDDPSWDLMADKGQDGEDGPSWTGEWDLEEFGSEPGPGLFTFEGSTYLLPDGELATEDPPAAPWVLWSAKGDQGEPGESGGAGFPGLTHFGGLVPLSTRANGYESVSFADDDKSMSRIMHVPFWSGHDVRFVFGNWNADTGIVGLGQLTVTAALETPYSWVVPITFGGRREVVIDPGGTVLSDPIGIDFGGPEHDFNFFYVRTFVVPDGGKFPRIYNGNHSGDSLVYGVGATDVTMSTGGVGGDGSGHAYGPCAVLTDTRERRPIVAVVGDSIAVGSGDTPPAQRSAGYVMRALDGASIPSVRHAKLAQQGSSLQGFSSGAFGSGLWGTSTPSGFNWFFPLTAGATHIIHQYGVNDLYAGGTSSAAMLTLAMNWGWLAARGLSVWQTTVTPITTSTDSWATVGNQTEYSSGFQTARIAVNAWIRGGGPLDPDDLTPVAVGTGGALVAGDVGHPLSGYFEVADAAESARDSGKWKANYTADGIHPNPTGAAALALAVDTDMFV